jgi:hypothetical protein
MRKRGPGLRFYVTLAADLGRVLAPNAPAPLDVDEIKLLDDLPAAIYLCDASGLVTWFNRRSIQIWGRSPAPNDTVELFFCRRLSAPDGTPPYRMSAGCLTPCLTRVTTTVRKSSLSGRTVSV